MDQSKKVITRILKSQPERCLAWMAWLFLVFPAEILASSDSRPTKDELKVGVRAFSGLDAAFKRWQQTIDYLSKTNPLYSFRMVPIESFSGMDSLVADSQVDFVLTQPVEYVQLEEKYGIARIATLQRTELMSEFGCQFIVRADSEVKTLNDAKGQVLGGMHSLAFGGFLMGKKHLLDQGYTISSFFSGYREYINQKKIIAAVEKGEIDVGMIRTGILPSIDQTDLLESKEKLRVLDAKFKAGFSEPHTTALYPEYAFAKVGHIPPALAKDVAVSLMQMSSSVEAALQGEYYGWTVPMNYYKVHELMKELQVGVFKERIDFSLNAFVVKYLKWLGVLLLLVVVLSISLYRNRKLHHRLKMNYAKLESFNTQIKKEMQSSIDLGLQNQKMAQIGARLATTLHDIKNPLFVLKTASRQIKRSLDRSADMADAIEIAERKLQLMDNASNKIDLIIQESMLETRDGYQSKLDLVFIEPLVREEAEDLLSQITDTTLQLEIYVKGKQPKLAILPIHFSQICTNLISNAIEALLDSKNQKEEKKILIAIEDFDEKVLLKIKDNGVGIDDQNKEKILNPSYSTKTSQGALGGGSGLGLNSVLALLDIYNGTLEINSKPGEGSEFVCSFFKKKS